LIQIAAEAAFDCGYVGAYHVTIIVFIIMLSNCEHYAAIDNKDALGTCYRSWPSSGMEEVIEEGKG
jgi:hypothetical protein